MASSKLEIEAKKAEEPQIGRDDDWDDTALIAAYDKAMNKARVSVRSLGMEVSKKKGVLSSVPGKSDMKSKKKLKWNIGDYCRATYSQDGLTYEAVINEIEESVDLCTIQFIGYGNEEEVHLSSLAPSLGKVIRQKQEAFAKSLDENGDYDDAESSSFSEDEQVRRNKAGSHRRATQEETEKVQVPYHPCYVNRHAHHYNMGPVSACPPPLPPPPMPTPPPFLLDRAGPEDDKLYSMLLSWYMSGYHTGYYMGSRQSHSTPSNFRNLYNYYGH